MAEKFFMTWEEYGILLSQLTERIKLIHNEKKFTYVMGIPRGGLPIAVHLSHHLDIPIMNIDEMFCYEQTMTRKDVLLVDDLVDTGKTFKSFSANIDSDDNIVIAVLYKKPWTEFQPDIFIEETEKWIVFPYEDPNEIPNR